jgi:hypothetical protein
VLKFGPDVKDFKQIKTGDRMTTKYFESTAFDARKPDERPYCGRSVGRASGCCRGEGGRCCRRYVEMKTRAEDIDRLGFRDFPGGNS